MTRTRVLNTALIVAFAAFGQELMAGEPTSKSTGNAQAGVTKPLTRDQVVAARRKFKIHVLKFDASQEFGATFPYSDYVRVRVTNGSQVTLPVLTVMTKRFDAENRMIGSARAPTIPVADLKPGQSAEVDYYPKGHLPGVKKITVEIESLIAAEDAPFFKELPQ
jgi:hypothetical protein